jgi:sulfite exporter TauE/SafE
MSALAVLLASLVGSLHCAGMCGGIATVVGASGGADTGRRRRLAQVAYHLGRGLGYGALGLLAGSLGAGLDELGVATLGIHELAGIVMAAVLVALAVRRFLPAQPQLVVLVRRRSMFARTGRWLAAWLPRRGIVGAGVVGLLTALLPCPWLWSFVVVAASTTDAIHGLAVMGAMWLGSIPALLAVGAIASGMGRIVGRHAPRITAVALALLAVVTVAHRIATVPREASTHACH